MNKEIIMTSISLLNAINNNDLSLTKELVENLNTNFVPTEDMQNLNQLISFSDIVENRNYEVNESLEYALNNLNNVINTNIVKWNINFTKLILNKNKNDIETFILNNLNKEQILDYEIQGLIQLCVTIDRYDLLNQIREIISKEV